jgi:hypothetical protein
MLAREEKRRRIKKNHRYRRGDGCFMAISPRKKEGSFLSRITTSGLKIQGNSQRYGRRPQISGCILQGARFRS